MSVVSVNFGSRKTTIAQATMSPGRRTRSGAGPAFVKGHMLERLVCFSGHILVAAKANKAGGRGSNFACERIHRDSHALMEHGQQSRGGRRWTVKTKGDVAANGGNLQIFKKQPF